jgi:hypothetical protein
MTRLTNADSIQAYSGIPQDVIEAFGVQGDLVNISSILPCSHSSAMFTAPLFSMLLWPGLSRPAPRQARCPCHRHRAI